MASLARIKCQIFYSIWPRYCRVGEQKTVNFLSRNRCQICFILLYFLKALILNPEPLHLNKYQLTWYRFLLKILEKIFLRIDRITKLIRGCLKLRLTSCCAMNFSRFRFPFFRLNLDIFKILTVLEILYFWCLCNLVAGSRWLEHATVPSWGNGQLMYAWRGRGYDSCRHQHIVFCF